MKKELYLLLTAILAGFSIFGQRPVSPPLDDVSGNFKSAQPMGNGNEHFLERGKDVTYTIHFQNTGTDTAQNLRITDTLSVFLDAAKLREESASHPFAMNLLEGNVVRFSFPNIRLPHSVANESASKGFVTFTVPQKANLPAKTLITNRAHIYFDFRPVVPTNMVFHTIIDNPTGTQQVFLPNLLVEISPNPVSGESNLDLKGFPFHQGLLEVFDMSGRLTATVIFQNSPVQIFASQFQPGHYFYKTSLDGQLAATGHFLVK